MTAADPSPLRAAETRTLGGAESAEVAGLVAAAADADGVGPIDDQVRLDLAHGAAAGSAHILGRVSGGSTLVAYGHVVRDDDGASAHLVVHPHHRRLGYGRTLVAQLLDTLPASTQPASTRLAPAEPAPTLRVWAHGDTVGAQALAASCSFTKARDLWQMRRPLSLAVPVATYPDDIHVRTFESGRDDEAWVALNAAAFATHPEQGRLTVDDLRHRMAEAWFDASGFFLAERDGALLGSHWTKVHPAAESGGREVGEVYAVAVHPQAQGLGLGKALTLTGLQHLRDRSLDEVMLYVDGDNAAATALYQRLGFSTTTVDVMYSRGR